MLPEEDSIGGDIVPDDDVLFAEFFNDLGDPDNSVPIPWPTTETSEASSINVEDRSILTEQSSFPFIA